MVIILEKLILQISFYYSILSVYYIIQNLCFVKICCKSNKSSLNSKEN